MAEPFFPLTALSEAQRAQALERFTIIRPALEEGVSQAQVARTSKKAPSTVRLWIKRYRAHGMRNEIGFWVLRTHGMRNEKHFRLKVASKARSMLALFTDKASEIPLPSGSRRVRKDALEPTD